MSSLLLQSGGLDSAVLAYQLGKEGVEFQALHMYFGQAAAERELEAVQIVAALLNRRFDVLDLRSLGGGFTSSSLTQPTACPNPGRHVLPLGTMLYYGPVLPYAHHRGFDTVYVGLTKVDADASAEYRQPFLDAVSKLAEVAGLSRITFKAPYINKTKEEVLDIASSERDLVKLTWSCILGKAAHCGVCRSCTSRKAAFKSASMKDPTTYFVI